MNAPDDAPRDFRWADAPRPDPDTGRAPLAPTPAADDPDALLAEATAWCADTTLALRSALVADLAEALRRAIELHKLDVFMVHTSDRARDEARRDQLAALAERDDARRERDDARRERDGLARRLAGIVAIGQGARYRLAPEPDDAGPRGKNRR